MASVDHFRKELAAMIDCATADDVLDILINAGELCRRLHMSITATDACCEAMRGELRPDDLILIEAGAGVGMTVKYRLPRPDRKSTGGHREAQG
jgi:hypothetical protein